MEVVGKEGNRVASIGSEGESEEDDNKEVVEEEESNTTIGAVEEVEVRWTEMSTMYGDETGNDLGLDGDGVMAAIAAVNGRVVVASGGEQGRSTSSSSLCGEPSS